MKSGFTLHDLPKVERPRERMQAMGAQALSSQELLALVLGRGVRGDSVMSTAQNLLSKFGSLEEVVNASIEELQKIRGLGIAKATQLKACCEIARRIESSNSPNTNAVIMQPSDVYKIVRSHITQFAKEHFFVLSFDVRNRFIGIDLIGIGILTSNIVHPRETFESAIRRHAAHIIVCHNHPSGNCDPSDEDLEVTKRLVESGRILGIHVLDHIIVSKTGYYSFQDNGIFES